MLKTVLFDMDGVVVDTEPLHSKAYQQLFETININVSDELYSSFTGQATVEICEKIVKHFKLPMSPQTLVDIKRDKFKVLFKNDSSLQLLDGVLDLIKDYHQNGLQLVLASSASMENINRIFQRFDLDQYFIAKISGAELKQSKPHPEIFLKAAKTAGSLPSECMVIEDSTNGIKAAKAAEIFCVGYDSENSKDQDYSDADLVIKDFNSIRFEKLEFSKE